MSASLSFPTTSLSSSAMSKPVRLVASTPMSTNPASSGPSSPTFHFAYSWERLSISR
jgi:hypothetical protein